MVSWFLTTFATVRYSTSYHNKAICRRILSYMPSSEGIFCFLNQRGDRYPCEVTVGREVAVRSLEEVADIGTDTNTNNNRVNNSIL